MALKFEALLMDSMLVNISDTEIILKFVAQPLQSEHNIDNLPRGVQQGNNPANRLFCLDDSGRTTNQKNAEGFQAVRGVTNACHMTLTQMETIANNKIRFCI